MDFHGEYDDYWQFSDGSTKHAGSGRNLIVAGMHKCMAAVMKQDAANKGFLYWAVGDGNLGGAGASAAWDAGVLANTTVPLTTDTALLREIFRKSVGPSDISYIDAVGAASVAPTNRLLITCTFLETEPTSATYYFREFGLYGLDATSTPGSGQLLNHKLHATYTKLASARLIRNLRISF